MRRWRRGGTAVRRAGAARRVTGRTATRCDSAMPRKAHKSIATKHSGAQCNTYNGIKYDTYNGIARISALRLSRRGRGRLIDRNRRIVHRRTSESLIESSGASIETNDWLPK